MAITREELSAAIKRGEFKEYLGDGLYVAWDGYMIRLSADRNGVEHWVGLEPSVMAELLRFKQRVDETSDLVESTPKENHEP